MDILFIVSYYLEVYTSFSIFAGDKVGYMKSTNKFLLLTLLQALTIQIKAVPDADRVFRTITASDGLADNSAQTIKCTLTGRMTITTIGNINFYDGANFSHINSEHEVYYKLEDYDGHYHLYYDNNHHLWLKNSYSVSCVNLTTETYIANVDSVFGTYGATSHVNDMFVDVDGNVWISDSHYLLSTKYRKKVALTKGLRLQDAEVYDKRLLMLFYHTGLLKCVDLKTGKMVSQSMPYGPDDQQRYSRSCVQLVNEGCVYLIRNSSDDNGGILMRYNIATRKWHEVLRSQYHLNNMKLYYGTLYIASGQGYYTYNLETGEILHYETLTLNNGRQLSTNINVIEFDLQGGMWAGTERYGLLYNRPVITSFHVMGWDDPMALKYAGMMDYQTGINEFKGKRANMMYIDSRRWTWVATPNGLYLYTTPQAEPMVISQKNGLLNNVIHAVVEDDLHNIWVSTSYGISCVHIKNNVVKQVFSFNNNDHVPNETFVNGKAMKLPSGEIVMQAVDHLVRFNPMDFISFFDQEPYIMPLKLTKLMVNGIDVSAGEKVNGEVVLNRAITRTREINLSYNLNSVSLTISALNFARPLQTFYRVRVLELGMDWREFSYFGGGGLVDSRGLLHLPLLSLNPGTYHIEAQASVVPGQFMGEPTRWTISVNQPWWRTTGILGMFGLVVLALAVVNFFIFNRNTKLKMKRNGMEGDVIRRIQVFVTRCDDLESESLAPTQEEIYGLDHESQIELSSEFVDVMLRVIPFVREREGRPLSMSMLAQATGMELLDFYDLVSENIHKSPRALIRTMRLDKVAEMLQTTDKTVEQVAQDCGFVSPNYMIAKFYHKFRMTPLEYRESRDD